MLSVFYQLSLSFLPLFLPFSLDVTKMAPESNPESIRRLLLPALPLKDTLDDIGICSARKVSSMANAPLPLAHITRSLHSGAQSFA